MIFWIWGPRRGVPKHLLSFSSHHCSVTSLSLLDQISIKSSKCLKEFWEILAMDAKLNTSPELFETVADLAWKTLEEELPARVNPRIRKVSGAQKPFRTLLILLRYSRTRLR
jgi:hypothetical protein